MEEDDDYMSTAFLNVTDDIRPGLVQSGSLKRKYELEKKSESAKKKNYVKPVKLLEEERRAEGLSSALSSENKGFSILQKMGYKPGMTLGKPNSSASTSAIQEPVQITLKSGRSGLGKDAENKQKLEYRKAKEAKLKVWKEKEVAELTKNFQNRMKDKLLNKKVLSDLNRCQHVCMQLDNNCEIDEPEELWFWPENKVNKDDDDDDAEDDFDDELEDLDPTEKLEILVDYLRMTHLYCVWCGTAFNDADDMNDNCPGNTREDHE